MSIKGKAYIAGIFEHPTRLAKDKSVAQLHAEWRAARWPMPGSPRPMSTAISVPATRPASGRWRWSTTWA